MSLGPLYVFLGEVSVQVLCPFFNWVVCLPGVESCEFFIYFGDQSLVWGIIGKYVFPYCWFSQFYFFKNNLYFLMVEKFIRRKRHRHLCNYNNKITYLSVVKHRGLLIPKEPDIFQINYYYLNNLRIVFQICASGSHLFIFIFIQSLYNFCTISNLLENSRLKYKTSHSNLYL